MPSDGGVGGKSAPAAPPIEAHRTRRAATDVEDLGAAQVAARRGGAKGQRPPTPLAEGHQHHRGSAAMAAAPGNARPERSDPAPSARSASSPAWHRQSRKDLRALHRNRHQHGSNIRAPVPSVSPKNDVQTMA